MMLNQLPPPLAAGDGWTDWPDVGGREYFDVLRYRLGAADRRGYAVLSVYGEMNGEPFGVFQLELFDGYRIADTKSYPFSVYMSNGAYSVASASVSQGATSVSIRFSGSPLVICGNWIVKK